MSTEINNLRTDWFIFVRRFSMSNFYIKNRINNMLDEILPMSYGLGRENHIYIKEINSLIEDVNSTYIQIFKNNPDSIKEINDKYKEVSELIAKIKLNLK